MSTKSDNNPPTDFANGELTEEYLTYEIVLTLWRAFAYMACYGTPDFSSLMPDVAKSFAKRVADKTLFAIVEDLKREAIRVGAHFAPKMRQELAASRMVIGQPLPQVDRDRLADLARELYGEVVRFDPDALPEHSSAILPSTDKKNGNTKTTSLKNAARDKWVAAQREKKNPTPWDEIYDRCLGLAESRGWSMPNGWKGLSEAYSRYLKHQRNKANQ